MCVKLIASQRWDVFLRHGVESLLNIIGSTTACFELFVCLFVNRITEKSYIGGFL